MGSPGAITLFSSAFWIAITITLFFIALLTYIYSGKKIKLTVMLTLLSTLAVGCAAGYDTWQYYLDNHFLAGLDQLGVPFRASRSSWLLLIDAWPLWAIPSFFLVGFISAIVWYVQKKIYKRLHAQLPDMAGKPKRLVMGLSSEMVANQLELDALKKALATANQKYKQVISEKEVAEARLKELEKSLSSTSNKNQLQN